LKIKKQECVGIVSSIRFSIQVGFMLVVVGLDCGSPLLDLAVRLGSFIAVDYHKVMNH